MAERLTPRLAEKFCAVPSYFLANYSRIKPHEGAAGLTSTEALLIIHLLDFKWTKDAPFPSVGNLAARLGISDRAVRDAMKRLEGLGLIKREARTHASGGRSSNKFHLDGLFKRLEKMLDDDELAAAAKLAAAKVESLEAVLGVGAAHG